MNTPLTRKHLSVLAASAGGAMLALKLALQLPWASFIFHLIIIAVLLHLAVLLSRLIAKGLPAAPGKLLLWACWAFPTMVLLVTYALFYISVANWGMPMHYKMMLSQVGELPYIIKNLPFNPVLVYVAILLPLLLIGGVYAKTIPPLHAELERSTELRLNTAGGRKFWVKNLLPYAILLSVVFFFPKIIGTLRLTFPALRDPVLALVFSDDVQHGHAIVGLGLDHLEAKRAYPEKLIQDRPNVILIICDALRADHLGAYGYHRDVSPFLDSLATLPGAFTHPRYFATSSVSFVGITTSLASRERLTAHNFMLHQLLKKQGYFTEFTFSGNFVEFYNLAEYMREGVDVYRDGYTFNQVSSTNKVSSANDKALIVDLVERAPDWDGQPVFKYLHFMSTHQMGQVEEHHKRFEPNTVAFAALDKATLENDYDNRVLQLDTYLRQAFNALKNKGYLDDAYVIITSDHGQSLLEGDHYWHGKSTDMSETFIPLFIVPTGERTLPEPPPDMVFSDQMDLAPTITDLLGLPRPGSWEGNSVFSPPFDQRVMQKQADDYSAIIAHGDSVYQLTVHENGAPIEQVNVTDPASPRAVQSLPNAVLAYWQDSLTSHFELR